MGTQIMICMFKIPHILGIRSPYHVVSKQILPSVGVIPGCRTVTFLFCFLRSHMYTSSLTLELYMYRSILILGGVILNPSCNNSINGIIILLFPSNYVFAAGEWFKLRVQLLTNVMIWLVISVYSDRNNWKNQTWFKKIKMTSSVVLGKSWFFKVDFALYLLRLALHTLDSLLISTTILPLLLYSQQPFHFTTHSVTHSPTLLWLKMLFSAPAVIIHLLSNDSSLYI